MLLHKIIPKINFNFVYAILSCISIMNKLNEGTL